MKIFVIAGHAGSGKSEVAKIISDYYNNNDTKCIISEFSKYLKVYAHEIVGWNYIDEKPRDFLQSMGSYIRSINPKFLINRMIEDIKIYADFADALVISDTRLSEEVKAIKDKFSDVVTIYVKNEFATSKLSLEQQQDITETALDDSDLFDYTIINTDLDLLKSDVKNIIKENE